MMPPRSSRFTLSHVAATVAVASLLLSAGGAFAQAASAPAQDGASMIKPPPTASGTGKRDNPDNMPILKQPRVPTRDRMTRTPPASAANAK